LLLLFVLFRQPTAIATDPEPQHSTMAAEPTPTWFLDWADRNAEAMNAMNGRFDTMNGRFDTMEQNINGRFDRFERLFLPASSDFFRDFPVLRSNVSEGIGGTRVPTWTMMHLDADADSPSRIFAVSSAHVGLKYSTIKEDGPNKNKRLFVQLPEDICAAGIKSVYLHPKLLDCKQGEVVGDAWDICLVELNTLPEGITRTIPYPVHGSEPPSAGANGKSWLLPKVFGCSSMGSVTGDCVAPCEVSVDHPNPYLLFNLREGGEQEDSGTLLFTIGAAGDINNHQLVGLFQGVSRNRGGGGANKDNSMRTRGKITPIPAFHKLVELCPFLFPEDTNLDELGSIGLATATAKTTYTISRHPAYKAAVTLTPVDALVGSNLIGVIVNTEQESGINYKSWASPVDGDRVDINYGPTTSVGGDSYDESCIAVKKDSTGDTSLQQETTPRGIKRSSDAVDCS
jgi:hypothetical protein